MLTRRVVPEDICYVTLGRKFVQHCQKQTEDRTVLEMKTSLSFELVSVLIQFSLNCKANSASDQFVCDFMCTSLPPNWITFLQVYVHYLKPNLVSKCQVTGFAQANVGLLIRC